MVGAVVVDDEQMAASHHRRRFRLVMGLYFIPVDVLESCLVVLVWKVE